MRKIGKKGKINIKARKMIADYCEEHGLLWCRIKLVDCMVGAHAPAHKKKRRYYKTAEELADPKEWLPACQNCHDKMEKDSELTKRIFKEVL